MRHRYGIIKKKLFKIILEWPAVLQSPVLVIFFLRDHKQVHNFLGFLKYQEPTELERK